jgi:pSer/pThr/pTyr-binding forkhead associated (FHA) protein
VFIVPVISESFVSRRHCEIKFNLEKFNLRDVGSTTGTFVMIRNEVALNPGMMFQMGLSEFKVNSTKENGPDSMELHVFEGPARNKAIVVNENGLGIGRDPANSFCVSEDSQMSNFHAKIYYDSNGNFCLVDVGSTNRTWLRLSSEGE